MQNIKNNNTRNTISFSVSKISFIFLMIPIDSTYDQNICVELLKATFTHYRSNYASKKNWNCLISTVILDTFPKFGG